MNLLAYTGPIYRQTKKKFLLEDESELQVDWMASKPVNFRFIRSPSQYSVGFWSHAKVLFKENFLRGIRWTTHLINKASILRAYGVPVTLRQLSPLNFALVTRRVWWEKEAFAPAVRGTKRTETSQLRMPVACVAVWQAFERNEGNWVEGNSIRALGRNSLARPPRYLAPDFPPSFSRARLTNLASKFVWATAMVKLGVLIFESWPLRQRKILQSNTSSPTCSEVV